jgi:hypothetical protein
MSTRILPALAVALFTTAALAQSPPPSKTDRDYQEAWQAGLVNVVVASDYHLASHEQHAHSQYNERSYLNISYLSWSIALFVCFIMMAWFSVVYRSLIIGCAAYVSLFGAAILLFEGVRI